MIMPFKNKNTVVTNKSGESKNRNNTVEQIKDETDVHRVYNTCTY